MQSDDRRLSRSASEAQLQSVAFHREFKAGETATSLRLDGFAVSIDDVVAASDGEGKSVDAVP
jgi:hypothetical protein